jgi:hypothetical protein
MSLRYRLLLGALLLNGTLGVLGPSDAEGQFSTSVRVEENFRREPNGLVLARMDPGAAVRVLATEGNWTEVEIEGWVWLRSLQASEDPSMDLVVSESEGENLRSGPSGTILGRLEEGTLLEELSRDPAWARVSRVGWIWTGSLRESPSTPAASDDTVQPTMTTRPATRPPAGVQNLGEVGGPILAAPDGDTLAVAAPASDLEVLRREGNWARVRLEGWMWMPAQFGFGDADETAESLEPEALGPEDFLSDPDAYAGRVVEWTIQFISLERAEAVRTDFFEGEPFLFARFGGDDGPFVYVALPADRLSEVEGLVPLEELSVTGRVRTGSSDLTGAPIIDLISMQRIR